MHKLKAFSQWQYALILAVANAISIGRIFLYAKLISVESFGHYASLTLVSNVFILIGSLGFITELQKTLPIFFKKGELFKTLQVLTQVLIIVSIVFLASSVICLLNKPIFGLKSILIFIGLLGGLSQLLFSIVTSETRAKLLLNKYSTQILYRNVAILFAGLVVVIYAKDATLIFLWESIVTLGISILLLLKFLPDVKRFGLNNILKSALTGLKTYRWTLLLSMFSISILAFLMQNGERYLANSHLSLTAFAVLSFGLIIPNIANTIQAIINSSIFTNQVLRFSDYGKKSVIRYSLKISLVFAVIFSVVSIPMYFISEIAIQEYYPTYIQILPYLPIIFAAFVIRSSDFVSNIFIIINKPFYVVVVNLIYLTLLVATLAVARTYNISYLSDPVTYFIINFTSAFVPFLMMSFIALRLYNTKRV